MRTKFTHVALLFFISICVFSQPHFLHRKYTKGFFFQKRQGAKSVKENNKKYFIFSHFADTVSLKNTATDKLEQNSDLGSLEAVVQLDTSQNVLPTRIDNAFVLRHNTLFVDTVKYYASNTNSKQLIIEKTEIRDVEKVVNRTSKAKASKKAPNPEVEFWLRNFKTILVIAGIVFGLPLAALIIKYGGALGTLLYIGALIIIGYPAYLAAIATYSALAWTIVIVGLLALLLWTAYLMQDEL